MIDRRLEMGLDEEIVPASTRGRATSGRRFDPSHDSTGNMRNLVSASDLFVGALLFYRSGKSRGCGGESVVAGRGEPIRIPKVGIA